VSTLRPAVRAAACSLLLVVALSACGDAFHRPAAVVHGVSIDDDQVRANVPAAKVLTALFRQPCGTQTAGEPPRSPCVRYTLGFLIQRQIVRAYAQAHGVRVPDWEVQRTIAAIEQQLGPDQTRQVLRQFGLPERGFERLIREQLLVRKVQQAVVGSAVGEQQLRAAYRRQRANFTLVHLAHVQTATKQDADRVESQITPDNFADLAKKYSIEKTTSGKGGDLGTVPVGRLPSDLASAALALQPGQVSKPIHTAPVWEIIKLISVQVAPYEKVRSQLRDQLAGPAAERWFEGQVGEGVEVNPKYGRVDPTTGDVLPLDSTATAFPSPSPSPTGP